MEVKIDERIQKIAYLDSSPYMKTAIAALMKCDKEVADESLACLEKIAFRNLIDGAEVMRGGMLMTLAGRLDRGEITPEAFRDRLADELVPASAEAVASTFAYYFTFPRQVGFIRWNLRVLRYLLFEYEDKLRKVYGNDLERIPFATAMEYEIDNILPQVWETYWRDEVEDFCDDLDAASRRPNPHKVLIFTLGNLLLTDFSSGSGFGNNPWKIKCERIRSGMSFGFQDVGSCENWGRKEIEARGRSILRFLGELIGCEFTEDQIRKALFATPEIYAEGSGENHDRANILARVGFCKDCGRKD